MTFSVVVISFNQLEFIKRLVAQFLDQDFPHDDYEVVIVECCSQDGSAEWLMSQSDPRVCPVILDKTCNRSAGRNRGIEAAHGEIIVMIDGDHTISRDFLTAHFRAHQRGHCAIVGKSDFASHPDFVAINNYLNNSGAAKHPRNTKLPGRYFLTRNCSVPRKTLIDIGLFDESFDQWGGEDLDLGVRIEQAGVPIYGEPDALALHHHFRPIEAVLRNMETYGKGSIPILIKKHPQLFRELNLDRLFRNPFEPDRFSSVTRFFYRLLCSSVIYKVVFSLSLLFSKYKQPRAILDYLHLRQYATGFARSNSFNT